MRAGCHAAMRAAFLKLRWVFLRDLIASHLLTTPLAAMPFVTATVSINSFSAKTVLIATWFPKRFLQKSTSGETLPPLSWVSKITAFFVTEDVLEGCV